MAEDKPFCISKWASWRRASSARQPWIRRIDDVSVAEFERKLKNNLYRIWNRMSSGSYVPPPVKRVMIRRLTARNGHWVFPRWETGCPNGREDVLGAESGIIIPPDSYGYRPGKSALDAVGACRQRCCVITGWGSRHKGSSIISIMPDDARGPQAYRLQMGAALHRAMAQAPLETEDGTRLPRERGTPQGGLPRRCWRTSFCIMCSTPGWLGSTRLSIRALRG